jgi:pimeloyl-ACP methyl ester carboxylesterase/DNA-binding winged helix-turn-helix (wHTH) protein
MSKTLPSDRIYAFGDYELDARLHELRCAGEALRVEPQVFDVLAYLLQRRDRLVSKEELLDAVWGHRFVSPTTLNSRIKLARQAVGDDGSAQRVIRTVHGRGFRVVADVEERAAGEGEGSDATLESGGEPNGSSANSAVSDPPIPRSHAPHTRAASTKRIEQQIRFCAAPDGVRIAYATSGTGPPLVKPANWLTHLEFDWESPVWRHWLRELSANHTLIRFDERGSGLSDRNVVDQSFESWVSDLETVVDEIGLERFPLFGLSQGCAVAIAYAIRHPERVTRLVLYGGYAQGRRRRARTPEELERADTIVRSIPLNWGWDNPAFRQFFAAAFLPEGTQEQWRWFCDLQRITTSPQEAVRLIGTAADIDVTTLAPRVTAPTLVLHATDDGVSPFEEGRKLAACIPGARFVPLESKNHVLLADEPAWARFLEEVRAFLAEDRASSGRESLARQPVKTAASAAPSRSKRSPRTNRG